MASLVLSRSVRGGQRALLSLGARRAFRVALNQQHKALFHVSAGEAFRASSRLNTEMREIGINYSYILSIQRGSGCAGLCAKIRIFRSRFLEVLQVPPRHPRPSEFTLEWKNFVLNLYF